MYKVFLYDMYKFVVRVLNWEIFLKLIKEKEKKRMIINWKDLVEI